METRYNQSHPHADHVESKIKKLVGDGEDYLFRHYDFTDITDDPGNTCLYMSFIQLVDSDFEEIEIDDLIELLGEDEGRGGPGDYEEFIVFRQNNEIVIIINSNR